MPSSSSTLVNTSDTAELRLVQLLSKSLISDDKKEVTFIQECEVCITRADASALFHRILYHPRITPTNVALMISSKALPLLSLVEPTITLTSQEATGAFTLLAVLLDRVAKKQEQVQYVHDLVSTLQSLLGYYLETLSVATATTTTSMKEKEEEEDMMTAAVTKVMEIKQRILIMLCTLYNIRSSYKEKCFLLVHIFLMASMISSSSSTTSSNTTVHKLEQDMILQLLPGRNTTLGTLLEYHNLVRLIEMEFTTTTCTTITSTNNKDEKEEEVVVEEEEEQVLTAHDKRLLYSTASQVLKQVIDISTKVTSSTITTPTSTHVHKASIKREKDIMEQDEEENNSTSWTCPSTILLERERTLAKVNQQRFLLKLLATYQKDTDLDTLAWDTAKEVTIGLILDPISLFHDQRGITRLLSIQALNLQPDTKPLYDLLVIFQTGKLEDFYHFLSSSSMNKSALQKYGIEEEICIHHLRLLSLCSLAVEHEEIPYAAIASTLQISMDQVEPWVISAVSSGLMSAKMDQLSQLVMVEQCVVRSFGMEEWKVLQSRLHSWKKNVGNIISAMKQQQQLQTNSTTASSSAVSLGQEGTSI